MTPRASTTPGNCLTLTRSALIGLVAGTLDPDRAASDRTLVIDGAAADLQLLMSLVAPVDPDFVIVTP